MSAVNVSTSAVTEHLPTGLTERFGAQLFEYLCTDATDGLWYLNIENPCEEWISPAFRELLGADPQRPVVELIYPDDRAVAFNHLQNHCADEKYRYDFILRFTTPEPGTISVRRRGHAVRNHDGRPLCMIGSHTVVQHPATFDSSEQTTTQRITELQEANERFRLFARSIGAGVWSRSTANGTDKITWTEEVWDLLGYEGPQEYKFGLFREHLDEHDRERYTEAITLMHQNEQPLDIEVRAFLKDGTRRWLRVTAEIVKNEDGTLDKVVGAIQDIEKLHRLQTLNLELKTALSDLQHQSMRTRAANEELCSFAYASSHDMKAPMNSLKLILQVVGEELDEGNIEFARKLVDEGANITSYGIELVDDILDYVQVVGAEQTIVSTDLSSIVRTICDRLRDETGFADVHITGPLPKINGDEKQLRILMYHLIHNAVKFKKSEVLHHVSITPIYDSHRSGVAITDTGIGIAKGKQKDIFKMFTRLNSVAEFTGNGLGLALCQRIALNHRAQIYVESTVGTGSTFTIWFPQRQSN